MVEQLSYVLGLCIGGCSHRGEWCSLDVFFLRMFEPSIWDKPMH